MTYVLGATNAPVTPGDSSTLSMSPSSIALELSRLGDTQLALAAMGINFQTKSAFPPEIVILVKNLAKSEQARRGSKVPMLPIIGGIAVLGGILVLSRSAK